LKIKKCQTGCNNNSQVILKDDVEYHLYHNCLIPLVNLSLTQLEWKKLSKIHGEEAFLLHSDFYDDKGIALQPRL
jgi:hypothetical protein